MVMGDKDGLDKDLSMTRYGIMAGDRAVWLGWSWLSSWQPGDVDVDCFCTASY